MVMESQQSSHHSHLASAAAVDFKPSSSAGMPHKEHKKEQEGDLLPVTITDKLPLSLKELMAGGIAGALAKSSVAPFERIKILYQTRRGNLQNFGILQAMRIVMREEGIRSFYRGNGASVLRIVPYAGLQFMGYEQYRRWIIECYPPAANGPFVDLVAGSLAGGTAVLLTYPLDLARTRLAYNVASQASGKMNLTQPQATSPAVYKGIGDVLTRVYRENGTKGLYRGVGATLCGILPYAGFKFYIYEMLKGYISIDGEASISGKLACGAVAGLIGQTFTYPLDVVRRQMQVQDASKVVVLHRNGPDNVLRGQKRPFKGTLDGLLRIVEAQGWRQLFAGLSLNYLKSGWSFKTTTWKERDEPLRSESGDRLVSKLLKTGGAGPIGGDWVHGIRWHEGDIESSSAREAHPVIFGVPLSVNFSSFLIEIIFEGLKSFQADGNL